MKDDDSISITSTNLSETDFQLNDVINEYNINYFINIKYNSIYII